jgi:glycosyltransferase involved in cell wall biosynthesis
MRSVSVVISTLDRADSLQRTLEALEFVDYPAFEVVVVSGPSTDHTAAVLEGFAGKLTVVACPERNVAVSRNLGIRAASGEIVAFIDDDAYPDPDWLIAHIREYDDADVAAVAGPLYDQTGFRILARRVFADRVGRSRLIADDGGPDGAVELGDGMVLSVMGCNASFRRDRLVEVGGFDEQYEYWLEETDLCLRLSDAGYRTAATDRGFVHHMVLPGPYRGDMHPVVKNHVYLALRHAGIPDHELERRIGAITSAHWEYREAVGRIEGSVPDREAYDATVARAAEQGRRDATRGPLLQDPAFFETNRRFLPFLASGRSGARLSIGLLASPRSTAGEDVDGALHELASAVGWLGHQARVIAPTSGRTTVRFEGQHWTHEVAVAVQTAGPLPAGPGRWLEPDVWNQVGAVRDEVVRLRERLSLDLLLAPSRGPLGAGPIAIADAPVVFGLERFLDPVRDVSAQASALVAFCRALLAGRDCARTGTLDAGAPIAPPIPPALG